MDASELLERYAAGERDFIGVDLSDVNLSHANLSDVNLIGVNLIGADLHGANLSDAQLSSAKLIGANLSDADLSGAKLIGADLYDAKLNNAKLIGADLYGADLGLASLIDASLIDANLSGVNLINTNLVEANLSNANLSEADLRFANLSKANLSNACLSGARLDGTIIAYQKVSEELQREKQELTEQVQLLQAQVEKQKLAEDLRQASNQGINAPYQWNGFYFRSRTEIRIAEALDRAGVLFYPNSKARLNKAEARVNRESDFLVFQAGKFGILEVDGREWHQTAADDHERDRLFKRHGIRVIERFDAARCWNEPDEVVQEFLEILRQA